MRWTVPKYGDVKIERKFAILPIIIDREVRWLEWVTVKYVYGSNADCIVDWQPKEFIDDNKEV